MEYFVVANSFAAPFFSDTSESFVQSDSPIAAMRKFVNDYSHPAGLYAAFLYADANQYHKHAEPLIKWQSYKSLGLPDEGGKIV